jgi:hypothetical protein
MTWLNMPQATANTGCLAGSWHRSLLDYTGAQAGGLLRRVAAVAGTRELIDGNTWLNLD